MIAPDIIFRLANLVAMATWLALSASLFVDRLRPFARAAAGTAVPALLALAYIPLIIGGFGEAPGGGFGSIGEVRALFASDAGLTAGWLHYLAFDLFVGAWIARAGAEAGVPAALLLPCLAATFLFGPAGLLLFLALRALFRNRKTEALA